MSGWRSKTFSSFKFYAHLLYNLFLDVKMIFKLRSSRNIFPSKQFQVRHFHLSKVYRVSFINLFLCYLIIKTTDKALSFIVILLFLMRNFFDCSFSSQDTDISQYNDFNDAIRSINGKESQ